jgi:hypothetical protein
MKAFETTRVCIIDDEPEEYLPMIQALSRLNIGSVHIAGDRYEELPVEPIGGLRLVFLDMKLGTEGDDAAITAHTAHVFTRVVSPGDGPVVVVVWTKHRDMVDAFRQRLYEANDQYRGRLLFTRIEKPTDGTISQTDELQRAVSEELNKFYPVDLLWRWEKLVHEAASATTEEVCRHATSRAQIDAVDSEDAEVQKLLSGFTDVLRILVSAEAGQASTPSTAFFDLLGVLNPLHRDRLEHALAPSDVQAANRLLESEAVASEAEKLELNTMLLVARHIPNDMPFRPGVLLRVRDNQRFEAQFGVSLIDAFSDCLEVSMSQVRKLQNRLESGGLDAGQKATLETQLEEAKATITRTTTEWFAKCVPVLLEISPSCDFAQRHSRMAYLITGLLIPTGEGISFKTKGAFYSLPAVRIPGIDTPMKLVFNSRFTLSRWPGNEHPEIEVLCRLREPILTDVRNWAAAQAARSGHVSL